MDGSIIYRKDLRRTIDSTSPQSLGINAHKYWLGSTRKYSENLKQAPSTICGMLENFGEKQTDDGNY